MFIKFWLERYRFVDVHIYTIGAMSEERAALLSAAVRAACLAKAPRRSIQAVASAVAGVLLRPCTASTHVTDPDVRPSTQRANSAPVDGCSAEELLAALREKRSAQRARKKACRKAAKIARAGNATVPAEPSMPQVGRNQISSTRAPAEHGVSQADASSSRSSAPVESAVLQGVSTCALAATNMPQTGSMVAPAKQGMPQASRNQMGSTRAPVEHGMSQAGVKQSKGDGSPVPKESALQQGVSSCALAETSMSQSGSTPAPAEHGKTQAGRDQMSRKRAPAEQGMPQAAEKQPQEVAATTAQSVSSASNDERDQWVARETEKPRAQKPNEEDAELQAIKEGCLAAARAKMAKQRQ